MRRMLRMLGWAVSGLVLLAGAVAILGPRDRMELTPRFDAATIGPDLDAWLAASEARHPGITPGTAKQVVWAGTPGARTPLAVVYLHGFSATSAEIRPVPDQVARALGANLYFTRLTGHGLDGAALGTATPEDWLADTAEALAIGRRLGDRVLVIGTSTGGTLAALAAIDPALSQDVAGVVLISPNFRTRAWKTRLLDLGLAPVWVPWIVGSEVRFTPATQGDATYWTNAYPISALFHLATLLRAARAQDYARASMPMLMIYVPEDQTVDEAMGLALMVHWGGPHETWSPVLTSRDDRAAHVITGDLRSPDQTAPFVARILDWARGQDWARGL